jgi:heme-binding NEAT domain protein
MKTAKKSIKAQIETQIIQMQYDMKARHQEELDTWEAQGGDANVAQTVEDKEVLEPEPTEVVPSEEEIAALKKAKAKKKQVFFKHETIDTPSAVPDDSHWAFI